MKRITRSSVRAVSLLACALVGVWGASARADEGMWLPNKLPTQVLSSAHGFTPTPQWVEHVQKSCVRISSGGSGSIVSPRGLVMTNHHVGSDMLSKLSEPGKDLLETGFFAASEAAEPKCPDLEINVLWTIDDVTDQVKSAAKPEMSPGDANTARRKAMATIEKAATDKNPEFFYEVVTLYKGGQYHLYGYKRYTDIRLVFAPEQQIAFYGGDADNFEFPRYDLDVCFFRIYENDKPLEAERYLKWSATGAKEGDLTFVVGHPGGTSRLFTVDHLKYVRDFSMPLTLQSMCRNEVELQMFSGRSLESERIAKEYLFGVANGRKAYFGQLAGLQDPAMFAAKQKAEDILRAAYKADPKNAGKDPWSKLAKAKDLQRTFGVRRAAVGAAFGGELAGTALTLVRLADEKPKPSADRLREYRDTNLPVVELQLYSPAPIYDDLEIQSLTSGLQYMAMTLGADDPLVVKALAGKSPSDRAVELVRGTKLKDVAERKRLGEGGADAVGTSADPMIAFVKLLDPESRSLRKKYEDEVEAVERESYAEIAAAKFAAEGDSVYPDATFTLRFAFGTVKGFPQGGKDVKPYTTFAGLYERAAERKNLPPFNLPPRWAERKGKLDLTTPMNFVCSADIIGGNSGSPVINAKGEVIGLVFDGNIQSLVGEFYFDESVNRTVAVDSRALIESLRKVCDAGAIADEIQGKGK